MDSGDKLGSELESFRQQWLSDLRSRNTDSRTQQQAGPSSSRPPLRAEGAPRKTDSRRPARMDDDDDYIQAVSFDAPPRAESSSELVPGQPGKAVEKELVTALDHYEKAVEKEALGSLGDSLKLYRKAFRLDSHVDQLYRKKHFPLLAQKPSLATGHSGSSSNQTGSQPADGRLQSINELISGFAGLSIIPAAPAIEGQPGPPCPIAGLPDEILLHISTDLAIMDVGDLVRLSLACKKLAYLVTEQQIWRRVCLGTEFGFGGMHYHWQQGISWEPLEENESGDGVFVSMEELARRRREESLITTNALLPSTYSASWQKMFRHRPRIRFGGCYISTVNYVRAGQASANQVTWNSPVHIVTYYRYLRLFRDGTAISLTTTNEPTDVVHHLTKEALEIHRGGAQSHLPSSVMQPALRGRWRLSSSLDNPDVPLHEAEGDLYVETEGVGKYIYRLELSLRSAGKGSRNNKLVWRGFYSYNKLTDDWGEFALKNDKPFFFSRVKSYGVGE